MNDCVNKDRINILFRLWIISYPEIYDSGIFWKTELVFHRMENFKSFQSYQGQSSPAISILTLSLFSFPWSLPFHCLINIACYIEIQIGKALAYTYMWQLHHFSLTMPSSLHYSKTACKQRQLFAIQSRVKPCSEFLWPRPSLEIVSSLFETLSFQLLLN